MLEDLEADGLITKKPKPMPMPGLPNEFITFDKRKALLERYGLTLYKIAESIKKILTDKH